MSAKITLDQWQALLAVVDEGGYANAAEALDKSQSAISYAVQKIETELGVRAFSLEGRKAKLTETGVELSIGEITLTPEVLDVLAGHPKPENVIVGVRPEQLEDAALIDGYERLRALTFEAEVDIVESLGADKYVYFSTPGGVAHAAQLDELAADTESHESEFVARLPAASKVVTGESVELAFDTSKIAIFDADTGVNLTIPAADE